MPLYKHALDISVNWAPPEVRMGELIPVAAQATIATGILAALTITPDTTLGSFQACPKNFWILHTRYQARTSGNCIVEQDRWESAPVTPPDCCVQVAGGYLDLPCNPFEQSCCYTVT